MEWGDNRPTPLAKRSLLPPSQIPMKRLHQILMSGVAPFLGALPSLAEEPAAEKHPVVKAPAEFTSSTPTPSQWNLPSMDRMFVSKKVHEVVTKKGGPSALEAMKD